MKVIPAINCKNFSCIKNRMEKAAGFLPKGGWVQLDISDGKFTKVKTWNNPAQLSSLLISHFSHLNFEIHLMVKNLRPNIKKWLKIADRIIFHFENLDENEFEFIKKISKKNKSVEFGIAITSKTPLEIITPFLIENFRVSPRQFRKVPRFVKFVQLLAVNPGKSGQSFNKSVLEKIKFLKKNHPKVLIEIDGGINPKTAKLVKKAGADIINSGSYIFDSKNPKEAYKKLIKI